MHSSLIKRLSYKNFFNDSPSFDDLLAYIKIKDSLLLLSSISLFEYKLRKHETSEIVFILEEWLININLKTKEQILDSFVKSIDDNSSGNIKKDELKNTSIINRLSTLRLIEIICALKNNNRPENEENSDLNLFKLYLLVNDEISNRQDQIFKKYFHKQRTEKENILFHLFLGLTHISISTNRTALIMPEISKFVMFEKWLSESPTYNKLSNSYLKDKELSSWLSYFNNIFSLCQILTTSNYFSIKYNDPIRKTLLFLTKSEDFSPQWSEFVNLKKNPIVELEKNYFIVLDFEFTLNKFFSSIYHDILEYSKGTNPKLNFHQDYNKLFVEEYLLKNTLKCSFKSNYIQFSENDIKKYKKKRISNMAFPDYYIRNGNKVILFECKNSFLSNNNKAILDTEKILHEIKSKFYYSKEKNNKEKSKAVRQLVKVIKNSYSGEYTFFDSIKNLKKIVYFPILIVMDKSLTTLGFNQLLDHYFQNEIANLDATAYNKIIPLTIIHFDVFLNYQSKLKKLTKYIIDYHQYIKKQHSFESMISFTDYLYYVVKLNNLTIKKDMEHIFKNSLLPVE